MPFCHRLMSDVRRMSLTIAFYDIFSETVWQILINLQINNPLNCSLSKSLLEIYPMKNSGCHGDQKKKYSSVFHIIMYIISLKIYSSETYGQT